MSQCKFQNDFNWQNFHTGKFKISNLLFCSSNNSTRINEVNEVLQRVYVVISPTLLQAGFSCCFKINIERNYALIVKSVLSSTTCFQSLKWIFSERFGTKYLRTYCV